MQRAPKNLIHAEQGSKIAPEPACDSEAEPLQMPRTVSTAQSMALGREKGPLLELFLAQITCFPVHRPPNLQPSAFHASTSHTARAPAGRRRLK